MTAPSSRPRRLDICRVLLWNQSEVVASMPTSWLFCVRRRAACVGAFFALAFATADLENWGFGS